MGQTIISIANGVRVIESVVAVVTGDGTYGWWHVVVVHVDGGRSHCVGTGHISLIVVLV